MAMKRWPLTPSEAFEHSQMSGAIITSALMSFERSGINVFETMRVSTAPPGTRTFAVTPEPSSSEAIAVSSASLVAFEPP